MEIVKNDTLIGERLKNLRLEKKMTQGELAKLLGIARSTLAGYETGKISPSIEVIIRICEFFGVSFNYMTATGEVVDGILDVHYELHKLMDNLCSHKYIKYKGIDLEVLERDFLMLKIKNTIDELNAVIFGE